MKCETPKKNAKMEDQHPDTELEKDTKDTIIEKDTKDSKDSKETKPEEKEEPPKPTTEELLAQANDRYLRARADFENYRKRMNREFAEIRSNTKEQTITEFLTVYDFFMLAIEASEKTPDITVIKQGMSMILTEFKKTFENLGVKTINTEGKEFDPNIHDAVSQEPSEKVAEGKIIRQWKPGFKIGDKLLRPATVVVSSGTPKKEAEIEAEKEADSKEQTKETPEKTEKK